MDDKTFSEYQSLRSIVEDFFITNKFDQGEIEESLIMLCEDIEEYFHLEPDPEAGPGA